MISCKRGACAVGCQPPQPPIVTFTCLLAVKNEPSFILATAMTFCVLGQTNAGVGFRHAARRREVEGRDAGARIAVGDDQHVGDMRLLGHRALDRDRHRHGVAVLGDFRQVELDPAVDGVLPPVNFLISSSESFLAAAARTDRANGGRRDGTDADRQGLPAIQCQGIIAVLLRRWRSARSRIRLSRQSPGR